MTPIETRISELQAALISEAMEVLRSLGYREVTELANGFGDADAF